MFGELFRPSRGRARVFLGICAFSVLVNYGRVAFAPLVDVFIQGGATPAIAGLAATAVWLGSAAPRLPTGYLLTFIQRHHIILGMGVWLSAAAALTAFAPNIWFIILGAFSIGLATGAFYTAASPLVSELFPQNVGVAVGVRGMFSQLAAVLAPSIVALTILLGSWRLGFIGLAIGSMIVTIAFFYATRRATLPTAGQTDRDLIGGIRAEWKLVVAGIAFVGITGFVWQGVFNFYVTFLGTEHDLSTGISTMLLTITFAAGVPSFLIGGRLADRFSFLLLLVGVLAGFSLTLLLFTLVEGIIAIALVSILMGLIVHALFPIGDAYLLSTLPDTHRSSAYSAFSASMMLLQAPGSVAVGLLAGYGITYGTVFRSWAILVAVLALGMGILALKGRLPRGTKVL